MRSLIARSLMAALTIGTMAVSQLANAQTATPVLAFGNDGLGLNNLTMAGIVPSVEGYTHTALAQGFRVGSTKRLTLTSVDIGLSIRSSAPVLDIAIYDSTSVNGLEQPGNKIGSFNTTPTNSPLLTRSILVYNFALETGTTVKLNPDTNYWIVVSYTPQVSGSTTFFWQFGANENVDTPTDGSSGSGFTHIGTVGRHDFANIPGGEWLDHNVNSAFPNSGLRIGVYGILEDVVVNPGGGGGSVQEPPVLDCYALSKGYFKNKFPQGWPASALPGGPMGPAGGALIGTQRYTANELRTLLATNSTGGNQFGQLASQLVAVHLSRELAKQTAGAAYDLWNGWAPDSDAAKAAYEQAAQLVGAAAEFDAQGKLTKTAGRNTLYNVSPLINALDKGYIQRFHCD